MTARVLPGDERPLTDVYRQLLDEAVLGEELGFSSWLLAEHHFAEDRHNPSQFPLLAAAAVRTERIRLGTYVLLLALHNPIRVAEDAATVDILSNGRLILAIGAGPMEGECAVFGIPPKERFGRTYEALEIIEKCFAGERFSHQGRYYRFADAQMTTTPVQPGGPPIYMAAMGPQSLAKAGERGYNLASVLHTPLVHVYAGAQAEAGRTRDDYRLMSGPVTVHIAPTRDQAWDEAERALHWWVTFYRRRGFDMPLPPVEEMRTHAGRRHLRSAVRGGHPGRRTGCARAPQGRRPRRDGDPVQPSRNGRRRGGAVDANLRRRAHARGQAVGSRRQRGRRRDLLTT